MQQMKTILLIIGCFFSFNSFSQKVTSDNLSGMWQSTDIPNDTSRIFIQFVNNNTLIENYTIQKHSYLDTLTYTINTASSVSMLHYIGKSTKRGIINAYYLLKLTDKNTLKMQGGNHRKPVKWDKNETRYNTLIVHRVRFTPPKIVQEVNN